MPQKADGTLTLPWDTKGSRVPQRVGMDQVLLCVTVMLTIVGLVMVFSASAVLAVNRHHDSWYYLKRQCVWLVVGLSLLHALSRMDYVWWKRLSRPLLGGITALLVIVLIPSLGTAVNGARRWLGVGPVSIQPAEMLKLAVVIYLAAYLARKEDRLQEFQAGLLPVLLVVGLLSGLVLMEPDLGTVVVLGMVTGSLLFVGGARLSHLSILVLCAVPIGLALVLSTEYRRQRLMAFLEPWRDASDTGFQITQSFLAFGSGGLFGVGLGEGKQKLFFLPEAHTDFVLALIGEELGFVGAGVIILLFVLFMIRGFQISTRARVPFGRYLGIGITTLIGVQVLVNACVVTGLVPTKGLTLPFVSYGGSSLVVSLAGVGMLLSISRDRHAGREEMEHRSGHGWVRER